MPARAAAAAAIALLLVAGCGSGGTSGASSSTAGPTRASPATAAWVDTPVVFQAGGMRIDGTLRHPAAPGGAVPAALLIAGSGPTDRNGNSPEINGTVGSLQTLADWLSDDGVASLRYDKLGTGQTGPAVFSPATSRYLTDEDRVRPAMLASRLPSGTPVLVTCSNADIQISCADVDNLVAGLNQAHTAIDFVHLDGVDHVLKQDPSRTAANYGKPLPFSPQLPQAIAAFLAAHGLGAHS